MLGSWDKQRALMAPGGACQVWTEGVIVQQLCCIRHPGPSGCCRPLVGRLCGSFVLCVYAPLYLTATLPLCQHCKCSQWLVASRRLPSFSQSFLGHAHATDPRLFVLLRCNCAGRNCCIQACKKSEVMLCGIHIIKIFVFSIW